MRLVDQHADVVADELAQHFVALTRRVPGLQLFDIKCAWFNEEEYCEFFPRTLFLRL
jgi:hypothetical protein